MVNFFKALGDEMRALNVIEIVQKTRGVSDREKNFLFNYLKEGDLPVEKR